MALKRCPVIDRDLGSMLMAWNVLSSPNGSCSAIEILLGSGQSVLLLLLWHNLQFVLIMLDPVPRLVFHQRRRRSYEVLNAKGHPRRKALGHEAAINFKWLLHALIVPLSVYDNGTAPRSLNHLSISLQGENYAQRRNGRCVIIISWAISGIRSAARSDVSACVIGQQRDSTLRRRTQHMLSQRRLGTKQWTE